VRTIGTDRENIEIAVVVHIDPLNRYAEEIRALEFDLLEWETAWVAEQTLVVDLAAVRAVPEVRPAIVVIIAPVESRKTTRDVQIDDGKVARSFIKQQ
jgi:hypothetical protein